MGYKAEIKGEELHVMVGATHPYIVKKEEGINFEVKDKVNIIISGNDKQKVGMLAAKIRFFRKADAYKGKGIKYKGEHIRRKAGKLAKSSSE